MQQPGSSPVPAVDGGPPSGYVRTENQGLAIASLVFGLLALLLSPILIGSLGGVVGLVLGAIHLMQRRRPAAMAAWGTGLSIVGIVASVGWGTFYVRAYERSVAPTISSLMTGASSSAIATGLPKAPRTWTAIPVWAAAVGEGQAICTGDWNGTGTQDVLVEDATTLRVYDPTGKPITAIPLGGRYTTIELNRNKAKAGRLLAYSTWSRKVDVYDKQGRTAWSYSSMMGVDGAHWGDLDGDGVEEMVVGLNGSGGLHALLADGKELWQVPLGNVWNQAIVSGENGSPARVLATEASGSVHIYDGKGQALASLKPNGGYYTQVNGMQPSPNSPIQILGGGTGNVVAFDPMGATAWSAPTSSGPAMWTSSYFVAADIDGDGIKDWLYAPVPVQLVMVTAQGKQLCQLVTAGKLQGFTAISRPHQPALLFTLTKTQLQAYTFK